ncbi:hypothetical protein ACU8MB_15100 [Rhizobium leguminosarum]
MPNASINRNLKWARSIDVGVLRQLYAVLEAINPKTILLSTTYVNGLEVEYRTVDEMLNAPTTQARNVKRLKVVVSEPAVWPPVEPIPLRVTVILEADQWFIRMSFDIQGDSNRCIALERQLDEVFHPTLLPLRSMFYLPIQPDWWIVLIAAQVLPLAAGQYGFNQPSGRLWLAGWLAGNALAAVYIFVKLAVFPRLQFNFGKGARAVARQKLIMAALFGFMIIGGFASIYQEYIKIWYFGASATEQGTANPADK